MFRFLFLLQRLLGFLLLGGLPGIAVFDLVAVPLETKPEIEKMSQALPIPDGNEWVSDFDRRKVRTAYFWAAGTVLLLYVLGWLMPIPQVDKLYHLTSQAAASGIGSDGRLGCRWGQFALGWLPPTPIWRYGPSSLLRVLLTWVALRFLNAHVEITGKALSAFAPAGRFGPFSMGRRLLGVYSAPLGSYFTKEGVFLPGEVRIKGRFKSASILAKFLFWWHQRVLDNAIDLGYWLLLLLPGAYYVCAWLTHS